MKKSQELIWRDAICEQAVFYLACAPRTRVGEDYPWILEYGSRHAGFNRIKKRLRQFEKRIKSFVKKADSTSPIEWFGRTYGMLYEVRNLFVDELSRVLFDHVLLLRLVGFEKYFFSWRSFSSLAEVKNTKPFTLEGFPSDYMGIPLQVHDFKLTREGKKPNDRRLVANSFFFSLLNNYHQYLIKRTEADFWPSSGMSVYDCGACIGDMSLVFADLVGPSGRVHVFDPVPLHIRFCAYQAELNTDLKSVLSLNELGVAKESSTSAGLRSDVNAISPAGLAIDCFSSTSLDDYFRRSGESVDLIKMDIEGFELEALEGARACLLERSPKLAISAYHNPDHLWQIPLLIKNINPAYRLFFAHHSPTIGESVVYATI